MIFIFLMTPVLAQRFEWSSLLLLLGVGLITTSLLMRLRKRRGSRVQGLTPHEEVERLKQQRGMRGDLEELMVEVEQLTKRFGSQLNAKSLQLERMLREADERIGQLQRLMEAGRIDAVPPGSPTPAPGSPPASPPGSVAASLPDAGTVSPSPPPPQVPPQALPASPPDDPLARSVFQLADRGLEPDRIAQQLGEHVGKIELILALRDAGEG